MQIGDVLVPPKWAQLPLNWLKWSTEQPQYPHRARTASDTPPMIQCVSARGAQRAKFCTSVTTQTQVSARLWRFVVP